jgi:CDGSH-type Zn-finger protein
MSETAKTPRIMCAKNGPYGLVVDPTPAAVPVLRRASGDSCAAPRTVGLCRCGGSKNKPFCDGTHILIGFDDRKLTDGASNHRKNYVGRRITIHDNRGICSHAGYCTDNLKTVFREDAEPWIDPDGVAVEEVIATIRKCPSGALSYSIDEVEYVPAPAPPMVTVTNNGPYAVRGGLELAGVEFGDHASREHYTLCRCGASKNKPFCDGSHWEIGFQDP